MESISFISDNYSIEGLLKRNSSSKGAIVTHPHPLYGGNMHNQVVESASRSYEKAGYTVLRFNFRGTGRSKGHFDEGFGEQNDVRAAFAYLKKMGIEQVDLVGYSFGAWVNAMLTSREEHGFQRVILISPPVAFLDFEPVGHISKLRLAIVGDRDEIASCGMVEKALPFWNDKAKLEIVSGGDHFFSGRLNQVEEILSSSLA